MNSGTFHAVGLGPGDPDLLTLRAVNLLRLATLVYVPFSRLTSQTWVEEAVRRYAGQDCMIFKVEFSLGENSATRQRHWQATARQIIERLRRGEDALFVTLGDPLLFSTAIYLIRALREQWPGIPIDIVPGVSAYAHCAALTSFAVGEGTLPVTIIPSVTALAEVQTAIERGGTLVLMKIGRHLPQIIDLLEDKGLIEHSVFVARAGLPEQHVEIDLRTLRGAEAKTGNMAIILVHNQNGEQ